MNAVVVPVRVRAGVGRWIGVVLVAVVLLLPLLGRESITYKSGLVLIFFVAASGLHVLVNWAGELSLAHFAMVGLPAMSVLALSQEHDISPIYLLPVAIVIGLVEGGIVALPVMRAKGIQVALVTLIAGIAISRFFFTQSWLRGTRGVRSAAVPAIGPFEFRTSRSLYLLLVAFVLVSAVAVWMMMHSKIARAWFWIRANPDAASAFGVPVVRYRIAAYAVGGAFGGFAGGLSVMWVRNLSPDAFPQVLSFSYLLIAVLAGSGFLGGVAVVTLFLQGGVHFASNIFGTDIGDTFDTFLAYSGPLGLIDVLVRHPTGFNGMARDFVLRRRRKRTATRSRVAKIETVGGAK